MAPEQGPDAEASTSRGKTEGNNPSITITTASNPTSPNGSRSPSPKRMARVSWIRIPQRHELEPLLEEFGLSTTGNVDELRQRLAAYVKEGQYDVRTLARIMALDEQYTTLQNQRQQGNNPPTVPATQVNTCRNPPTGPATQFNTYPYPPASPNANIEGRVFERVRQWGLRCDGGNDPIDFIERIEELAQAQQIQLDQVPFTLSESLQGDALAWWRNRKAGFLSWENFKQSFLDFFLPSTYWEDLEDNIRRRFQMPGEPIKLFILDMESRMRHSNATETQKLDRIYANCLPIFRRSILPGTFDTLTKFLQIATHIERTLIQEDQLFTPKLNREKPVHAPPRNSSPRETRQTHPQASTRQNLAPIQNPATACRRCGEQGHQQFNCPNPTKLFCWECGKQQIRTNQCCRATPREVTRTVKPRKNNQTTEADMVVGTPFVQGRTPCVSIRIGNHTVRGIIDTGAITSVLSQETTTLLAPTCTPTPAQIKMTTANGALTTSNAVLSAIVQFKGIKYQLKFIILPVASDAVILGMDFLTQADGGLLVGGHNLKFQTQVIRRLEIQPEGSSTQLNISTKLEPHVYQEVVTFLQQEINEFQSLKGTSNLVNHRITMKNDVPIKARYQSRNPAMLKIIYDKVDELLEKDCIESSSSAYSAPIVLVRKKNNKWRLCIDYRQLNANSIPDAYPLPRIQHILDRLQNAKVISSLDLKDGYWQIAMHPESRKYTAFTVPGRGLFQWKVMPFGLHSAPATFQRALDQIIGPELEPYVFAYLDDIIITSPTVEDHLRMLGEVFNRLKQANLRINPEKCEFFKEETKYLGHVVSAQGIHTDPEKISAIKALQPPTNIREVRRCLGIASWYRRFVPEFARVVQPITGLLKKGKHFTWKKEQQEAFELLKKRLTEAPVLACPDFNLRFKLQTDASDHGLGVVLTQESEGLERVIAYASRQLNPAEKNYSVTEKECLAVVWGTRKMREYLEGYRFTVVTDHLALKWLNSMDNPTGRVARWALELQQLTFDIEYRKGKYNILADALSRQPEVKMRRLGPTNNDLSWVERKVKEVRTQPNLFPDFMLKDQQLYRFFPCDQIDDDKNPWKLCVPTSQRNEILKECHDEPSAGHLGVRKTTRRVQRKYYWPGMGREIAKYVKGCPKCQQYKVQQQKPAGQMNTHFAEGPWTTICADFIGPLPRSKRGNTFLLVFQDKFTKWVELIPLRVANSEGVIRALRERIIAHFGVPRILITDNGTPFVSKTMKTATEEWGISHQLTAPYTPQENAVERANRIIKTMIAQYTENDHRTWDQWLPELAFAINTSESETTGQSPAYINFGRDLRPPRPAVEDNDRQNTTPVESASGRAERLREIHEIVRQNMREATATQAKYYNQHRRDWHPEIGQQVWYREHHLSRGKDGFAAKLAPKYTGPGEVIAFVSPNIVHLKLKTTTAIKTVHVQDLKPWHSQNP